MDIKHTEKRIEEKRSWKLTLRQTRKQGNKNIEKREES